MIRNKLQEQQYVEPRVTNLVASGIYNSDIVIITCTMKLENFLSGNREKVKPS